MPLYGRVSSPTTTRPLVTPVDGVTVVLTGDVLLAAPLYSNCVTVTVMVRATVGLFQVKLVSITVYVPPNRALTPLTSDGTGYWVPPFGVSEPLPTGTSGFSDWGASGPGR